MINYNVYEPMCFQNTQNNFHINGPLGFVFENVHFENVQIDNVQIENVHFENVHFENVQIENVQIENNPVLSIIF